MFITGKSIIAADAVDINQIVFDEPAIEAVPSSTFTNRRIKIGYRLPDGSVTQLQIPFPKSYSYGIQAESYGAEQQRDARDKQPQKVDPKLISGYTMPLCLWEKNSSPTPEQEFFLELIKKIAEKCKDGVLEKKSKCGKHDLEKSDLKKILNALWFKRDDEGKVMENFPPVLNTKLIIRKDKATNTISDVLTKFRNGYTSEIVDARTVTGGFFVQALVCFDSIYVSSKITVQVKCPIATFWPRSTETEDDLMSMFTKMTLDTTPAPAPASKVEVHSDVEDEDEEEEEEESEDSE